MPNWNEKPVAVPTLNINLKPCSHVEACNVSRYHIKACAAAPVLLPCPLPRSVTFEVRLGECACSAAHPAFMPGIHHPDCPGNPIRVSCSIGGESWEKSRVLNNGVESDGKLLPVGVAALAFYACQERWTLVKALVLGHTDLSSLLTGPKAVDLLTQRDVVYAALADMARAEQAALEAQERVEKAFPYHRFHRVGSGTHAGPRPSHARLAAYVEFLVEQIGVLS